MQSAVTNGQKIFCLVIQISQIRPDLTELRMGGELSSNLNLRKNAGKE
jgi:hypothetical protein